MLALERMGVIFHRGEDGKLGSRAFGGQQRARTYFVGDITGQALLHVLYEQLIKHGLRVYEEWFVLDLIVEDGVCKGCVAMDIRTGQLTSSAPSRSSWPPAVPVESTNPAPTP